MPPTATAPLSPYRWTIRILAVLVAAMLVYRFSGEMSQPAMVGGGTASLSPLGIVPPFSLTERNGRTISNRDLSGKVWVADFIYTTCPGPCPLVTASMARLQNALAGDTHVQLVSFTVDPQTDTPAVLAKYADQFGADPDRWWFLTGPEKPLYDLIQNGFMQTVQDNRGAPPQPGQFTVTHSTRMALIDAGGTLRGFYDGLHVPGQADLLRDIKVLEKEEQ